MNASRKTAVQFKEVTYNRNFQAYLFIVFKWDKIQISTEIIQIPKSKL